MIPIEGSAHRRVRMYAWSTRMQVRRESDESRRRTSEALAEVSSVMGSTHCPPKFYAGRHGK